MYSIDTSGFLDGMKRHYPPDAFPGVWDKMSELAAAGNLKICEMVKVEFEKRDDEAQKWFEERPDTIIALDEKRQGIVRDLLAKYPRLVDTKKGRSGADPFVIALALSSGCPVITGEVPSGNIDKPKIPDVCAAVGVPTLSFLQLIQRERWVFK